MFTGTQMHELTPDVIGEIAVELKMPSLAVMVDRQLNGIPTIRWYYHRAPEEMVMHLITHNLIEEFNLLQPELDDEMILLLIRSLRHEMLQEALSTDRIKLPITIAYTAFHSYSDIPHEPEQAEQMVELLQLAGVLMTTDVVNLSAYVGNLRLLKRLVQGGMNPDGKTMCAAAVHGHLNIVKWLVQFGVEPDFTAAYDAAQYGHLELLEYLIEEGIIPTSSILNIAIENGHLDIAMLLLRRGITLGIEVAKQFVIRCNYDQLREVYQSGQLDDGEIIVAAAMSGDLRKFKFLLDEWINETRWTPTESDNGTLNYNSVHLDKLLSDCMTSAICAGQVDIVEFIHQEGGKEYTTEMMNHAAICGQLEMAKRLYHILGRPFSSVAFVRAARHGIKLVQFMIDKLDGPIHEESVASAAEGGCLATVKFLVERGVSASPRALMNAAYRGHIDIIRYLLDRVVLDEDLLGRLVYLLIRDGYQSDVIRILERGIPPSSEYLYETAIDYDRVEVLKLYDRLGVQHPDNALERAALGGRYMATKYLLSMGDKADDELADDVLYRGLINIAELLFKHGYSPDINLETDNPDVIAFLSYIAEYGVQYSANHFE